MNWQDAQKAELKSWLIKNPLERKEKIEREIARYPKLRKEMGLHLIDLSDKFVVEIGGGPIGIIADLHCRRKVIIDPLADKFKRYWPCPYHQTGMGENLPFRNGEIDLIVICNALDHCQSPEIVLWEVKRVLRAGGWLAIHNCLNLASIHRHPAHKINLDEDWFLNQLNEYEFVHYQKVRYGWVKFDGRIGQPAIAFLARLVTKYELC